MRKASCRLEVPDCRLARSKGCMLHLQKAKLMDSMTSMLTSSIGNTLITVSKSFGDIMAKRKQVDAKPDRHHQPFSLRKPIGLMPSEAQIAEHVANTTHTWRAIVFCACACSATPPPPKCVTPAGLALSFYRFCAVCKARDSLSIKRSLLPGKWARLRAIWTDPLS